MGCALPFHSGVCVAGNFNDLAAVAFLPPPRSPTKNCGSRRYDLIFAGSCLSGLGIVMKKPSSIRGHVKVLSSTVDPYQKI